jgi:hypothetical protein
MPPSKDTAVRALVAAAPRRRILMRAARETRRRRHTTEADAAARLGASRRRTLYSSYERWSTRIACNTLACITGAVAEAIHGVPPVVHWDQRGESRRHQHDRKQALA